MSYLTANGVDTVEAQTYTVGSANTPKGRLDTLLRRAERRVRALAPLPEKAELQAQYRAAAADCELEVFAFLFNHPAHLSREAVAAASADYTTSPSDRIAEIVRGEMPEFFVQNSIAFVEPAGL